MNPKNTHDQTAPDTQDPTEEVTHMVLRKRKVSAEQARRAWDSLSEADKAVLLTSARNGYAARVERDRRSSSDAANMMRHLR